MLALSSRGRSPFVSCRRARQEASGGVTGPATWAPRRKPRRLASRVARAACGILVLSLAMDASAQNGTGERRSGWYIGAAGGVTGASSIDHTGFSQDPQCYPTSACFDQDPRPEFRGYRWTRDLAPSVGATFELAAGHVGKRTRFELSFGQRKNDVDQILRSFTTLDGTGVAARRGSTVASNATEDVDDLSVRTLAVTAYYHFRDAASAFSPYVGAGAGPAFVDLRGFHYSEEFFDTAGNGAAHDPPLSSYNISLDDDFSDTVPAGHVHAGADFGLNDRTALGIKLTYSMLGDFEYTGTYQRHGAHRFDPDFTHTANLAGAGHWSLQFTVRYVLGRWGEL